MDHTKPLVLLGASGDHLAMACAARDVARRDGRRVPVVSRLIDDLLSAYGDGLLEVVAADASVRQERGLMDRIWQAHRRQSGTPHAMYFRNYLGTFRWLLGLEVGECPRYALPDLPYTEGLPPTPYAVIQPRSVRAANPGPDLLQPLVYRLLEAGWRVYGVGKQNTRQELQGVDWSMLRNSALHMACVIRHAALVLSPRSFAAHLAAGYNVPCLLWLPDDGENWHMDFEPWTCIKVRYALGGCALLHGLDALLAAVVDGHHPPLQQPQA